MNPVSSCRKSPTDVCLLRSSCPLDVKHYPFDRQTCTLSYASWAYDGTKIDLQLNSGMGSGKKFLDFEWAALINICVLQVIRATT